MTRQTLIASLQNDTDQLHSEVMQAARGILSYDDLLTVMMLAVKIADFITNGNDTIQRADITNAINALHCVNDPTASDLAERIDRWYYESLIEFRIRST